MSSKHTRRSRGAPGHGRRRALRIGLVFALLVLSSVARGANAQEAQSFNSADLIRRTLDGSNNNLQNTTWGQAGFQYRRVAQARYADGVARPVTGQSPRRVSNRVFNDVAQNLFSENQVTQWGFTWGQFLDHTFGLRATAGGESQPLPFSATDPLESFRNDFGAISFTRTPAAPGTGVSNTRQQINTVDSYIDASSVFSNSATRLEWLRQGSVDGNLFNNSPSLLLPNGELPTVGERGNPATAPVMDVDGRLRADPTRARVAGDVRANENIALLSTHTLFAREHNRIVSQLPTWLSATDRFEIARKVVGAEQQFITYNEFLPALGVQLAPYQGYNPNVNATLSNEFAVVGYRAHSMIHGELEPEGEAADYTAEELQAIEDQGVEVEVAGDDVEFVVPLNVAFFNPDLLSQIGLGPVLKGIGGESQYKNDEQIDNQLRSVLFQVPVGGNPECLDGPGLPECFNGVIDLGAIDIERGRDHGMPSYNALRQAYGLPAKSSFTAITGESTSSFPLFDPQINPFDPINDPDILDFVKLFDIDGNPIGSTGNLDAFVGMLSEKHMSGTDFGELQYTIWKREFERLRDGDRFFYANDGNLDLIRLFFGIDFRRTLSEIIVDNTELETGDIAANVFKVAP